MQVYWGENMNEKIKKYLLNWIWLALIFVCGAIAAVLITSYPIVGFAFCIAGGFYITLILNKLERLEQLEAEKLEQSR